jgi:hypothetical protein
MWNNFLNRDMIHLGSNGVITINGTDVLMGSSINFNGSRGTNAANAVDQQDYVTLNQMQAADSVSISTASVNATNYVNSVANIIGSTNNFLYNAVWTNTSGWLGSGTNNGTVKSLVSIVATNMYIGSAALATLPIKTYALLVDGEPADRPAKIGRFCILNAVETIGTARGVATYATGAMIFYDYLHPISINVGNNAPEIMRFNTNGIILMTNYNTSGSGAFTAYTSTNGVLNMGLGGFAGGVGHFNGSPLGTLYAINTLPSFNGNFADWQNNGVSKFLVSSNGNIHAVGLGLGTNTLSADEFGSTPIVYVAGKYRLGKDSATFLQECWTNFNVAPPSISGNTSWSTNCVWDDSHTNSFIFGNSTVLTDSIAIRYGCTNDLMLTINFMNTSSTPITPAAQVLRVYSKTP